jgi:hypothetical protein
MKIPRSKVMEILLVGAEMIRADRETNRKTDGVTDMVNLERACRDSAHLPETCLTSLMSTLRVPFTISMYRLGEKNRQILTERYPRNIMPNAKPFMYI